MERFLLLLFFLFICFSEAFSYPEGVRDVKIPNVSGVDAKNLQKIAPLVEKSIAENNYPGAVILVSHQGHIIYRGVFGNRRIIPDIAPMRFDTIFDLASLTKVVATTPAIMQLIEQRKLKLDDTVTKYWPSFASDGKDRITMRELLTHTSGLPADIPVEGKNSNEVLHQIENLQLKHPPGSAFIYSDINFIILGRIVEIISREPLNQYVNQHIFKPLGMNDTAFLPANKLLDRIAPTELVKQDAHEANDSASVYKLRWGAVHDPMAFAMGGVSGNAGLFSDAHDLAIYSQWLLDAIHTSTIGAHVLAPSFITKMISPQTPKNIAAIRGFGWDINSYFSDHGSLFSTQAFGHTGWTGTSLLIDPLTQTWIIFLTSRTHPHPFKINPMPHERAAIADIVATSINDSSIPPIHVGAEQINLYLPLLNGKRVAVFANQSSLVGNTHLVDELLQHHIHIKKIFAPEHGFRGDVDVTIKDGIDPNTHIPIISLYGKKLKPTPEDLRDIDILVFDIQDVGVRFYTYISSLQKLMEAAVENNKPLIILDRPNPNGFYVDGPTLELKYKSFTGMQPIPLVYGMTIGEYAKMLVGEQWLNVFPKSKAKTLNLTVIPCVNYTHASLYEPSVKPSPNLPDIESIYWYPSIGLMEATVLSVGRGTDKPFQVFGHPLLPTKFSFIPTPRPWAKSPPFKNKICHGWDLSGNKEDVLKKINHQLQIQYLINAYRLFPDKNHFFEKFNYASGNDQLIKQIEDGESEDEIRRSWEPELRVFKNIRKKYLIYPDNAVISDAPKTAETQNLQRKN